MGRRRTPSSSPPESVGRRSVDVLWTDPKRLDYTITSTYKFFSLRSRDILSSPDLETCPRTSKDSPNVGTPVGYRGGKRGENGWRNFGVRSLG